MNDNDKITLQISMNSVRIFLLDYKQIILTLFKEHPHIHILQ